MHSWYDLSGKLLATANFGTYGMANEFGNGTPPLGANPDGSPPYLDYTTSDPRSFDAAGNLSGCGVVDEDEVPDWVRWTCYRYDAGNRQDQVRHADGTVSHSEFDGLGRLLLTIENATDADANLRQVTAREYDSQGRLIKMAAVLPGHGNGGGADGVWQHSEINWGATDGSLQVTEVVYGADGADVVRDGNVAAVESSNKDWIREVRFPSDVTGQPDANDRFLFQYYSDGMIATRTDQRGIKFTHVYDELGRRVESKVNDVAWFSGPQGTNAPPDQIRRIVYAYAPTGEPTQVTAYSSLSTSANYTAKSVFAYDSFRNLESELQYHWGSGGATNGEVKYDWSSGTHGYTQATYNRLASITYPLRVGGGTRHVSFDYGEAGTIDDEMNRVRKLWVSPEAEASGVESAAYEYTGSSRRVSKAYNKDMTQTVSNGTAYTGLDRFGRLLDLDYQFAGMRLHRYQYRYDDADNVTSTRVTHADWDNQSRDNVRSFHCGYDKLQRLIAADMGAVDANGEMLASPTPVSTAWNLDNLGNWNGDPVPNDGTDTLAGLTVDWDGNAATVEGTIDHLTKKNNEMTGVVSDPDGSGPGTATTAAVIHDAAGNIVFDGANVYQYDAFNRLVQVSLPGTITFNTDGRIISGTLGSLIFRHTYDALGRVAWKQLRESATMALTRVEDYYYDGIRRIYELIRQPLGVPEPPPCQESSGVTKKYLGIVDEAGTLQWVNEVGTLVGPELPPCGEQPQGYTSGPDYAKWTGREYVYGVGDVDEFVVQYDENGKELFVLQDQSLRVVGLVDLGGMMIRQDAYSPYGEIVATDIFEQGYGDNRIGHHGLFFDRIVPNAQYAALVPGGVGLYQNRNRTYNPQLGRFMQRDPNATELPVLLSTATGGEAAIHTVGALDLASLYSDGLSLHAALRSNPMRNRDPLGLSAQMNWDFEVDMQESDWTGNRLYALGALNEGAKWASLGLQTTIDIAWGFFPGSGLVDAFRSAQLLRTGQGGFWDVLAVVGAAIPAAKAGMTAIKHLAALGKARFLHGRHIRMHCNCFVGETAIETPSGDMPIQCLSVGDEVLTRDQDRPSEPVRIGQVTHVFRDVAHVILHLTLTTGETMQLTRSHPFWTYEHGWIAAEHLSLGDTVDTRSGDPASVVDVVLDPESRVVYNIEVAGTGTYFASDVWVHNRGLCPIHRDIWRGRHGAWEHVQGGHEVMETLVKRGIPEERIRWNQALVSPDGQHWTHIRPDVQWVDDDGLVYVVEIVNTNPPPTGRMGQIRDALGSRFGGYEVQHVTDP